MRDWMQKSLLWIAAAAVVISIPIKLFLAGPVEPEKDFPTLAFHMAIGVAGIVFCIWLLRRWK